MTDKIRILLADSYTLFTEGLRHQFKTEDGLECIGIASDYEESIRLAQELAPDVVLLDIAIAEMRGPETCKHIKYTLPQTAIIVLTHDINGRWVINALKAGVNGYLLKKTKFCHLVNAIRIVHGGGIVYDRSINDTILRSTNLLDDEPNQSCELHGREMEVLKLAAAGMSYKEIAQCLNLSEHTVGSHFTNIYRKIGVQSRTEAVLYGLKRHWYSLRDSTSEDGEATHTPDWDSNTDSQG
jgi:NarL family two-component system response regulator LiaR